MVAIFGETLMEVPVPIEDPPQEPANHCVDGEPPTAVSVTVLPAQLLLCELDIEIGAAGTSIIVCVMFAHVELPQVLVFEA